MLPRLSVLCLIAALASGCATTAQRGDAVTWGSGNLRTMHLPKFPIGERGTHDFVVSGLEEKAYPFSLRYHNHHNVRGIFRPSFVDCVVKVEVLDFDTRKTLASKTVYPTSWRYSKGGTFEQYFWGPSEPGIAFRDRYRVRATVLKPTFGRYDEGQLFLR